jgi:FixJ family two-component response regulator
MRLIGKSDCAVTIVPTVILVDDDAAARRSLRILLEAQRYHVRDFSSGRDALAALPDGNELCLIIDYIMPDLDGLKLLVELRRSGWTVPAYLITGHHQHDLLTRARAAGYVDVFEKPLQNGALLSILAKGAERYLSA